LLDKTCKGHNPLLNTDLIFCDFSKSLWGKCIAFRPREPMRRKLPSCPTKWRHHFGTLSQVVSDNRKTSSLKLALLMNRTEMHRLNLNDIICSPTRLRCFKEKEKGIRIENKKGRIE